jgi:hypothetical protein
MKNIKNFDKFSINENYKLPAATGDSDKDEETFWFSTENKEKSLVLDLFLDMINISVDSGEKLKDKEVNAQDFRCSYKSGDKFITYTYEFWTTDDSIVKRSKGKYEGHEWMMRAEVPFDIIEKLNSEEIKKEQAEQRIKSESNWTLVDGMDPKGLLIKGGGGWQLAYILQNKETESYLAKEKAKDDQNPSWIKKFSGWLASNFG